jgi:hypothetical protein
MKPEFTVSHVSVDEIEEGGIALWLADADPVKEEYLTFHRVFEPDEQSVRLGLNRVYAERNDQGFSGYGGIESVSLFRDHLDVYLNDKGSRFMDGLAMMKVFFELDGADFQKLREGLVVCFDGFEKFHDAAGF